MNFWPYHSGNSVVDGVLFVLYCLIAGWGLGLGWRVAQKLP